MRALGDIADIRGARDVIVAKGIVRSVHAIGSIADIIGAGDAIIAVGIEEALRSGRKSKNDSSKRQDKPDGFHWGLFLMRKTLN